MSVEKNRIEAQRWLKTAQGDLESALVLMKNKRYAHSCFHSQQAGEKAIKALWYFLDADPWGHSILKLINDLASINAQTHEKLKKLSTSALMLDRFYITTRYPNGLPDLTPDEAYLEEDAINCLEDAKKIIKAVKPKIVDG
jgi:HEPN domain-containing protein